MKSSSIFKDEIKTYTVSRLDSLSNERGGKQVQNRSDITVELAIYDKGTRLVRQKGEDSYLVSTIHIYSEDAVLNYLDELLLNGLTYSVLEIRNDREHSFCKAIANV